jgi:protein-disulfide isomerase
MVLEYGDFECPDCGLAYPVTIALLQEFADRMGLVFRHFPLASVHSHAQIAAEAAETAGAQGKFWEMHDALFENQNALDPDDLMKYATRIALDVNRFRADLMEHRYAAKGRDDFMSGVRSGVHGTPTFFINGIRYEGPHYFDSMYAAIEAAADEGQ